MTTKLDPRVKEAWCGALLSGEYKQGTKYLRSKDDEFCCLGVLCDVLGVEWDKDTAGRWCADGADGAYGAYCAYSGLPRDVTEDVGVSRLGRLNKPVNGHRDLAFLNDIGAASFEEIAHVIMEQF